MIQSTHGVFCDESHNRMLSSNSGDEGHSKRDPKCEKGRNGHKQTESVHKCHPGDYNDVQNLECINDITVPETDVHHFDDTSVCCLLNENIPDLKFCDVPEEIK